MNVRKDSFEAQVQAFLGFYRFLQKPVLIIDPKSAPLRALELTWKKSTHRFFPKMSACPGPLDQVVFSDCFIKNHQEMTHFVQRLKLCCLRVVNLKNSLLNVYKRFEHYAD